MLIFGAARFLRPFGSKRQRSSGKSSRAEANARAFALNFDGKETAGILEVSANSNEVKDDAWYSLDGVRLSGKPTQRGLYINNGCKVAVK